MNMLRHFLKDFMTFVPLQLPQLLDVTTMEGTALKSYSGNAGIVPRSWQDWKKFRQSF